MTTKPKTNSKKAAPAKATPAAPKVTAPAPAPAKKVAPKGPVAPVAKKVPVSNFANNAGKVAGKIAKISKGKGLIGLATAGVIGAGAYLTARNASKPSPAKSSTASNFNKGKDPIQQYGVKQPSAPTVVKKPAASTPSKTTGSTPTKTGGGSKSSPSKIRKPDSFSRKNIAKGLSAKSVGVKSSSPIGKTPEGAVKNVSLSRPSSTASKSSVAQKPTLKDLRKEKRSERKLTRKDRRENRIINKPAKLKSKR